jgi:hypothetical protein
MHSIDQLLALPGGGFAYSLVESYRPLSDRELRWRKPN